MCPRYHWTSEANLQKILDSKEIRYSTGARADAAYGDGVYLTDLGPKTNHSGLTHLGASHYDVCIEVQSFAESMPCPRRVSKT